MRVKNPSYKNDLIFSIKIKAIGLWDCQFEKLLVYPKVLFTFSFIAVILADKYWVAIHYDRDLIYWHISCKS